MAPIDHDLHNDNRKPLLLLGTYVGVTASLVGLIAHRVLYRAYSALPPAQATRHRQDHRRKHVTIFVGLSVASLALATYYIASVLNISYQVWAYEHGDTVPSWIWGGEDLFTPDGSLNLRLGRWLRTTNVVGDAWEVAMSNSRRVWWTQQLFLGRAAWSLFLAIDGHRRNIPHLWAFISLAGLVSLAFAQNLYFVAALLTPTPLSDADKHSDLLRTSSKGSGKLARKASRAAQNTAATAEHAITGIPHRTRTIFDHYFPAKPADWAPHPLVYSVPVFSQVFLATVSGLASNTASFHPLLVQTFLSLFAPALIFRLCPLRWGTSHSTREQSGRRALNGYRLIAILSMLVHFSRTVIAVLDNDTSRHRHYYFFRDRQTVLQHTTSSFGRVLGAFAEHPACGHVAWDVILSGLSLIVWASVRGLNGGDMLRAASLASKKELEILGDTKHYVESKVHKIVDHATDDAPAESAVSKTRARRTAGAQKQATIGELETEADGEVGEGASSYRGDDGSARSHDEDASEDWESGALAWGLLTLTGLGAATSGVLGSEAL